MPFFLQMVGAGPTTALSLHLSAVLTHAQWPTITCHELYEHHLLSERIPVIGGHARVPEEPGLGVEMNEDALERYRVDEADHSLPKRLIRVTRPGDLNVYFVNSGQKWVFFGKGNLPVDEWGLAHGARRRRWQRRVCRSPLARLGITRSHIGVSRQSH